MQDELQLVQKLKKSKAEQPTYALGFHPMQFIWFLSKAFRGPKLLLLCCLCFMVAIILNETFGS